MMAVSAVIHSTTCIKTIVCYQTTRETTYTHIYFHAGTISVRIGIEVVATGESLIDTTITVIVGIVTDFGS